MRHLVKLFLSVSLFTTFSFGQENQADDNGCHEIRLDVFDALVFPNIEVNYEYIFNKFSGLGTTFSISLDEEFSEYQKFAVETFFRQYLFLKRNIKGRGLFVEGDLRLAGGEDMMNANTVETRVEDWIDLGLGITLGYKWVNDSGFVFEINAGGGRYLFGESDNEGYARGGILVGYRF